MECCSRKLCQRDCSLSEADRVLEFLIKKLHKLESEFAKSLVYRVEKRVKERRLKIAATLMGYLENPRFLKEKDRVLEYANRKEITNLAIELYVRLFHVPKSQDEETEGQQHDESDPDEPEEITPSLPKPPKRSPSNELREDLDKKRAKLDEEVTSFSIDSTSTIRTAIKEAMKL